MPRVESSKDDKLVEWRYWPDTTEPTCIPLLTRVYDSNATQLYIDGTPPGIERELLRDVFITTQHVCLDLCGDEVYGALRDALEHPLCMIETLALVSDNTERIPPSVFTANKSLRRVDLYGSAVPDATTGSRTIEEFYLQTKTVLSDDVWQDIYSMPALRCIMTSAPQQFPPPHIHTNWPQCEFDLANIYIHRARRYPNLMPLRHRQRLRALYECAGKILPDHVIADIAAELIIPEQRLPIVYGV